MTRRLAWGALLLLCACPRAGEEPLRKGHVYFSAGKFDEAAQHYEEAAKAAPKDPRAREGRANVAYERGNYDVAEKWYREAIAVNPNAITSRNKLAVTLAAKRDVAGAMTTLNETLKVTPDNTYALFLLGGLHRKQGQQEAAEKAYLKALEIDEGYHAARFALANVLSDSSRLDEAEHQYTRLAKAGQTALAEYGFARLAARKNRPKDVRRHLLRVLEQKVAAPERIAQDEAFSKLWAHPDLADVRAKIPAVKTATRSPASAPTETATTAAP